MSANGESRLPALLQKHQGELLTAWVGEQKADARQATRIQEQELRSQCTTFLDHLSKAAETNHLADIDAPQWADVRGLLAEVSRSRGLQGFSPSETATFVFS